MEQRPSTFPRPSRDSARSRSTLPCSVRGRKCPRTGTEPQGREYHLCSTDFLSDSCETHVFVFSTFAHFVGGHPRTPTLMCCFLQWWEHCHRPQRDIEQVPGWRGDIEDSQVDNSTMDTCPVYCCPSGNRLWQPWLGGNPVISAPQNKQCKWPVAA